MYRFNKAEDSLTGEMNPFFGLKAKIEGYLSLPRLSETVLMVRLLDEHGEPLTRGGLMSHLRSSFPQYSWEEDDLDLFLEEDGTVTALLDDLEIISRDSTSV